MVFTTDVMYRYRDVAWAAPLDEYENPIGESRVSVELSQYPVVKKTPCGVWVDAYGRKRFVKQGEGKRFAHPTKEAALKSFLARKRRQSTILTAQLRRVEKALALAESMS